MVVRDDGIVVTSAALAPGGSDVWVRMPDGTAVVAEVLGADPATGLSVLDLEDQGYTAAVLALEGDLVAGETPSRSAPAPPSAPPRPRARWASPSGTSAPPARRSTACRSTGTSTPGVGSPVVDGGAR